MAGWWSAGRTTRCLRPADCTGVCTTCSSAPDMLSGFTIVRNAVSLDYPIVPALRSILAICDEVVVNVGRSPDGTRDLVAGLGEPRVRVIDTAWDFSRGSGVLAQETERAMRACRGAWGLYIQADEVLHETGAAILQERVRAWDADAGVEGLLVDYRHFYGDFDTVATNRHWYRREVRCVRLDRDIHSFQDAQGFRVGPGLRRRSWPLDASGSETSGSTRRTGSSASPERASSSTGTTWRYDGASLRGTAGDAGGGVQSPLPPQWARPRGGPGRAGVRGAAL